MKSDYEIWKLDNCPVTNLPIIRKSDWEDITFDNDNYRLTISRIGTNIFHIKTWGYSTLSTTRKYFELINKIIDTELLEKELYYLIEDYTDHTGASIEAKNCYVKNQKDNKRLQALIFYGTSSIFKLMIKLTKRIVKTSFTIDIVDNYKTAIKKMSKEQSDKIAKTTSNGYIKPIVGKQKKIKFTLTSKPEWKRIDLGDNYYVTFQLIDSNILKVIPEGDCGQNGIARLLEEQDKILEDTGLLNNSRVYIWDYSRVKELPPKKARKQFADSLIKERESGYLKGFYGYNIPLSIRMLFNIGTRLYKTTYPIKRVININAAIEESRKVLGDDIQNKTNIFTKNSWTWKFENFCTRFSFIDNDILMYESAGNLRPEYIRNLFKLYLKVIKDTEIDQKGYHYQIADWENLKTSSYHARKQYINEFIKFNKKYPCRLYVIFGINKYLKAILKISSHIFPVPIRIANDLNDAYNIIRGTKIDKTKIPEDKYKAYTKNQIKKYTNDLLKFIGTINWDQIGINSTGITAENPLKVLYEAISIIKDDFDSIIHERNSAERSIAEQNKFNKLRAEIWKISSQEELSEKELIQKLLNEIGPSLNVSRACYNIFTRNNPHKGDLNCIVEWCDEGVTPSLGMIIPNSLLRHFVNRDIFLITPESALKVIAKPLRTITKPLIKVIEKKLNLSYISVAPYYHNNKLKGWFTFDICKNNKVNPEMSAAKKSLISEMINIISLHIEQKQARKSIQKAYRDIEKKVNERTIELIKANEALHKARLKEERANVAKSRFLANMSHDIRIPLNSIMGFSQIIEKNIDGKLDKKYAFQITEESKKMMQLIDQLLDLSKIEAGKIEMNPETFSLREIINSVIRSFKIITESKGLYLKTKIDRNIPDLLNGDQVRLRQVLNNIVSNAIKFTKIGGVSISIGIENRAKDIYTLLFKIKDTGCGIPGNMIERIFESYMQINKRDIGTGLGMSISKQIIKLMNGRIWVESEIDIGSTFLFTADFGQVKDKSVRKQRKEKVGKKKNILKGKKVLVVEDYLTNQRILKKLLEMEGCIVTVADDGVEALEKIRSDNFDIILTDITIPRINGIKLTRLIREMNGRNKVPIIGVSGDAYKENLSRCINAGMNAIIQKPFDVENLLAILAKNL